VTDIRAEDIDAPTMRDAQRLFVTLTTAADSELTGLMRARAFAVPGAQRLPRRVRKVVTRYLNSVLAIIYYGKRFDGAEGVNVWLGGRRWARFQLHRLSGTSGVRISYDTGANPKVVRQIVSHVRPLGSGRYLCLMTVRRPAGYRQLLYFTLEPGP